MIIKFTSTHPEFLSLVQKNPTSFEGVQLRQVKNGVAIGHIISPQEYHLVFQDTKYSFSEDRSYVKLVTSRILEEDFEAKLDPRL